MLSDQVKDEERGGAGNYELRVTNYEWTSDARGARYVTQRVVRSTPPPLKRAGHPPSSKSASAARGDFSPAE